MPADTPVTATESRPDQFFVQAVCFVGGLALLFHPILFTGNRAMLHVLESNEFYPQWPGNYYYLPVIAGLLFLVTAATRNYRPGLSGVFGVHAVIACGIYALCLSLRTVELMMASRAREFTPGMGSWMLLLLSFVPVLAAGLLATLDSREFEPVLATWLRSAAGACILTLFVAMFNPAFMVDAGTPRGFRLSIIFGVTYSAFYVFTAFHPRTKRPFAIGTGIGYPLVAVPFFFIVLGLSRLSGPLRPEAHQALILLIAANVILWVAAVAAAIGIRPRHSVQVLAGSALSFGAPVLVVLFLLSLR